jgi:glycosyltransferase involved in cell wall biosynthesis
MPAWKARREVFTGPRRVPIATNSSWTTRIAETGFQDQAEVKTIWLGLDVNLFQPLQKWVARSLLGLPEDAVIAICGAINLKEERKGGRMLQECIAALSTEPNMMVLGFGQGSQFYDGIRGLGSITDERQMALLFNAADFIINAAKEEAFGQTLMEAAACGLPIVGTDVGGVKDIARPGENALLVEYGDTEGMLQCVRRVAEDLDLRRALSRASRKIVELDFSLQTQAASWSTFVSEALGLRACDASTPAQASIGEVSMPRRRAGVTEAI